MGGSVAAPNGQFPQKALCSKTRPIANNDIVHTIRIYGAPCHFQSKFLARLAFTYPITGVIDELNWEAAKMTTVNYPYEMARVVTIREKERLTFPAPPFPFLLLLYPSPSYSLST